MNIDEVLIENEPKNGQSLTPELQSWGTLCTWRRWIQTELYVPFFSSSDKVFHLQLKHRVVCKQQTAQIYSYILWRIIAWLQKPTTTTTIITIIMQIFTSSIETQGSHIKNKTETWKWSAKKNCCLCVGMMILTIPSIQFLLVAQAHCRDEIDGGSLSFVFI